MPRVLATGQSLGQLCQRGHDDWVFDVRGAKRCRTCRNAKNNKVVVQATHPQKEGPLGQLCRRGHDNWMVNEKGSKRCRTCKNKYRLWSSRRYEIDGRRHHDTGTGQTLLWDTLTYSEVMKARQDDAA